MRKRWARIEMSVLDTGTSLMLDASRAIAAWSRHAIDRYQISGLVKFRPLEHERHEAVP
jgi:hypothetical protein